MTVIAAILDKNGTVTMGGDSALTDESFEQVSMAETKVFFNGELLIGASKSARGGQLMRYKLVPPKQPSRMDADKYMATVFMDELRKVFKDGGHMFFEEAGSQESSDVDALIGYRAGLWIMYGDLQIERLRDPYAVVGSGGSIALGSLHTSKDVVDMSPRKRIEAALKAACAYNAACRSPFTILELASPKRKEVKTNGQAH